MAVKLRDNSNKLLNLLKEYGLENRVIDGSRNLDSIFAKKQDNEYVATKEVIRRREDSMAYLKEMIEL